MTSGGPGSGLYVSRDGGDTWKQLTGKGDCRPGEQAKGLPGHGGSASRSRRPTRRASTP